MTGQIWFALENAATERRLAATDSLIYRSKFARCKGLSKERIPFVTHTITLTHDYEAVIDKGWAIAPHIRGLLRRAEAEADAIDALSKPKARK